MLLFIAHALAGEPATDRTEACRAEAAAIEAREPGIGPLAAYEKACPGEVHWTEIQVRSRPRVRRSDYPKGETGEARCVVRVEVSAGGKVLDANAKDTCPEAFREAARRVALRYTFYPLQIEPPQNVAFDLVINFVQPK